MRDLKLILEYLESHNKNLTNEQYNKILEALEILDMIEEKIKSLL